MKYKVYLKKEVVSSYTVAITLDTKEIIGLENLETEEDNIDFENAVHTKLNNYELTLDDGLIPWELDDEDTTYEFDDKEKI